MYGKALMHERFAMAQHTIGQQLEQQFQLLAVAKTR